MPRDECTCVSYPGKEVLSRAEKNAIERVFGRHINDGQVRYLKAGHLDVLESRRAGIRFVVLRPSLFIGTKEIAWIERAVEAALHDLR
jgi:hypothetical protein